MLASRLLSSCSLASGSTLDRMATSCHMLEENAPAIIVSTMQVEQLAHVVKLHSALVKVSLVSFFNMCWFNNAGCLFSVIRVQCVYFQQDFYKVIHYHSISMQFVGTVVCTFQVVWLGNNLNNFGFPQKKMLSLMTINIESWAVTQGLTQWCVTPYSYFSGELLKWCVSG